jgi:hypothetical protein
VIVAGVAALPLGDGTSGSGLPQAAVSARSTIAHADQTRIRLILPDRDAKRLVHVYFSSGHPGE